MRSFAVSAAVLTGALVLAGCGSEGGGDGEGGISVSGAYMPQPVSDDMAAGFLTIVNDSGTKAELTSVTSDVGEVTLHETADGTMEEVQDLAVPAHGQLVFKSGGTHLMFDKLKHKPEEGQTVAVELHFAEADPVVVKMPVKSATYIPKTGQ
ncbi:copper chaperone PCu(A)C [Streptomyces sp. NBC_01604]|uniref:copper chaperone PCu(A)C n=1 Tax=Streptomyces sp. NBC_01604 TaxID=2975894 RepID=UPI00386B3FD0